MFLEKEGLCVIKFYPISRVVFGVQFSRGKAGASLTILPFNTSFTRSVIALLPVSSLNVFIR